MNNLTTLVREINQKLITDYAEVSGDKNPIHIDSSFAQKSQFKGTIAHGMIIVGYFSDFMDRIHGSNWSKTGRIKVKFRNPARPGDTLSISGELKRQEEISADSAVTISSKYSLKCHNQRGELISSATAEVVIND
ncbi:MAG: MaoC family dehydratase [Dehalococcoidia bacterium]